jgi:hypothetical protein
MGNFGNMIWELGLLPLQPQFSGSILFFPPNFSRMPKGWQSSAMKATYGWDYTLSSKGVDNHPISTMWKMFMSISSMIMDECCSSIFTSMRSGMLRLKRGQTTYRSEAIRVSFAWDPKGVHGFYPVVMPRELRNCWFQGRSCSRSALLHGSTVT